MKKILFATVCVAVLATPALAADEQYRLIKDTVGNCAAVIVPADGAPGMEVISDKTYSNSDDANAALDNMKGECKGIVQ